MKTGDDVFASSIASSKLGEILQARTTDGVYAATAYNLKAFRGLAGNCGASARHMNLLPPVCILEEQAGLEPAITCIDRLHVAVSILATVPYCAGDGTRTRTSPPSRTLSRLRRTRLTMLPGIAPYLCGGVSSM